MSEPTATASAVTSDGAPEVAPEKAIVQPPAKVLPPLPEKIHIDELHELKLPQVIEFFWKYNLRFNPERSKHSLIFDLLRFFAQQGIPIYAEGMVELTPDGTHGFLRWPRFSFKNLPDDAYVAPQLVRQFGLRTGHRVTGRLRAPRDREKFMALEEISEIEGLPTAEWKEKKPFDLLTATFPKERIVLESPATKSITVRAVDLIAPFGRGQRALIVAPPRVGKTIMLKEIAKAICASSPETHLILLLVDERPEEVTDFRRDVNCDIFSSTFDENPTRHVQVAEMVSERAKRLVECGKHVVILLDSITRLARGYNNLQPGRGRVMSGGVDTKALLKPKRFFGAARCVEEGGSLTIIATALIETQSRMDDVIFEEFKGTGNSELRLDRSLAERRIFPAIHILNSGTRRDDLLYHPQEFERIQILRRTLASMPAGEAMEVLVANLRATKTNAELLLSGLRNT